MLHDTTRHNTTQHNTVRCELRYSNTGNIESGQQNGAMHAERQGEARKEILWKTTTRRRHHAANTRRKHRKSKAKQDSNQNTRRRTHGDPVDAHSTRDWRHLPGLFRTLAPSLRPTKSLVCPKSTGRLHTSDTVVPTIFSVLRQGKERGKIGVRQEQQRWTRNLVNL